MQMTNPFGPEWYQRGGGGVPFGYSSFGYHPGSGEFGADPGALSQTTREQWEMVPGHREWDSPRDSPGSLYTELTGRKDGTRQRLLKSPYLLAQYSLPKKTSDIASVSSTGLYTLVNGRLFTLYFDGHWGPADLGEEVIVTASLDPPTVVTASPDPPRWVPPANGLGAATIPPASRPSLGDRRLAPAPPNVSAPPGPAVPGARSGAASSLLEWLYKDSLGILYNGGSRDAFKQSLPVDTGSIPGNYAINTWLSLSNVVAEYLSAGVVITNKVDDFFNRHLGYGAIQTILPMSKAMGIAVEAGPALAYATTWMSTALRLGPSVGAEGRALQTLAPVLESALPLESATEASMLFKARDEAVRVTNKLMSQDLAAGHITLENLPKRYGTIVDAIFKANVRQAVAEGSLPSTFVTSPTVRLNRGFPKNWFNATDVWDTATGRSWDSMTPYTAYFYKHELKYLGAVMPDGTIVTEVNPLFYSVGQ